MNITKRCVIVVLALLAGSRLLAADRQELRALVHYPITEISSSVRFTNAHGFFVGWNVPDSRAEVTELSRRLKNTPDDAETLYRMARLYKELDENERGRSCYQQALDLFAKRRDTDPKNGWLLAQYADVWYMLASEEHEGEAEPWYRKAVELSPDDWRCWMALGAFINTRATSAALHCGAAPKEKRQSLIEQVQKFRDEASACFDRAGELAPNNPELYAQRALERSGQGCLEVVLKRARGEELGDFRDQVLTPSCLADLCKISELRPTDCQPMVLAAISMMTASKANSWTQMPKETQQALVKIRTNLQKLSKDPNPRIAAGAFESLGVLQLLIWKDSDAAETSLHRATELDPTRSIAWNFQLVIALRSGRAEEAIKICGETVRHHDTVLNRLTFAHFLEQTDEYASAHEQVLKALALDANSPEAHIAEAAFLIKYGDDKDLPTAEQHLRKAADALAKAPSKKVQACYCLVHGICLALRGDTLTGRLRLQEAIKCDGGDDRAEKALQILAGSE